MLLNNMHFKFHLGTNSTRAAWSFFLSFSLKWTYRVHTGLWNTYNWKRHVLLHFSTVFKGSFQTDSPRCHSSREMPPISAPAWTLRSSRDLAGRHVRWYRFPAATLKCAHKAVAAVLKKWECLDFYFRWLHSFSNSQLQSESSPYHIWSSTDLVTSVIPKTCPGTVGLRKWGTEKSSLRSFYNVMINLRHSVQSIFYDLVLWFTFMVFPSTSHL